MSWNYRILDFGTHFSLHEVHYDNAGVPKSFTAEPCGFLADREEGPTALVASLQGAVRDASERPVIVVAEQWPDLET